jgi:hypothetical protein
LFSKEVAPRQKQAMIRHKVERAMESPHSVLLEDLTAISILVTGGEPPCVGRVSRLKTSDAVCART